MVQKLRKLLSATAIRLTVLYFILFASMAMGLVFYIGAGVVDLLKKEVVTSINSELKELSGIYEENGLNGIIRELEIRSHSPGSNLYVVLNPAGEILASNVYSFASGMLSETGWTYDPFQYDRFGLPGEKQYRALARIVELPNGVRLLVGRDIGEPEQFRELIFNALAMALVAMAIPGFMAWFFVGRRALRRIDRVTQSTDRIMSGDREERLPVSGSGDEFDRLSRGLNMMLDRINQLDEGLKQVSDNIAHDLKTPITRIHNAVEAGLTTGAKGVEHYRKVLGDVREEAKNLIKTFNALLMISRVEAGSSAAQMEMQNLSEVISDMTDFYEPAVNEAGFRLITKNDRNLKVRGNRELLSQMISNLIDNAMKYGQSNNQQNQVIRVETFVSNNGICVVISDNGHGIPGAFHKKVLDRFYRLEKGRNMPGSGLGLSLVSAIAKLHHATLKLADNQPGLRVELVFPEVGNHGAGVREI